MKKKPHDFSWPVLHWMVCKHCGLMRLRNKATEVLIRRGCDRDE